MSEQERITTRCPTCGNQTLFVGSGGNLTCSWVKCPEPGVERAMDGLKAYSGRLHDLVLWALGEIGEDFPSLPDDWPKRKFYWRHLLRHKLGEAEGRGRAA